MNHISPEQRRGEEGGCPDERRKQVKGTPRFDTAPTVEELEQVG